jgi:hypothetical protein
VPVLGIAIPLATAMIVSVLTWSLTIKRDRVLAHFAAQETRARRRSEELLELCKVILTLVESIRFALHSKVGVRESWTALQEQPGFYKVEHEDSPGYQRFFFAIHEVLLKDYDQMVQLRREMDIKIKDLYTLLFLHSAAYGAYPEASRLNLRTLVEDLGSLTQIAHRTNEETFDAYLKFSMDLVADLATLARFETAIADACKAMKPFDIPLGPLILLPDYPSAAQALESDMEKELDREEQKSAGIPSDVTP